MPRLWQRLRTLRSRRDRELHEELSTHLRMDAEARIGSGIPPEEAYRGARRDFGSPLRADGDPAAVQRAVREAIWSVDRSLPAYPAQTLDETLRSQVATPQLYTILFGAFAAFAVVLAALGTYGLFTYFVGRRTNEIAVRVALGGRCASIIGMGVVGAVLLTRVMRGLLFEVSPSDPATFAAVVALLMAVALAACYVPARRAASIEPAVALRQE